MVVLSYALVTFSPTSYVVEVTSNIFTVVVFNSAVGFFRLLCSDVVVICSAMGIFCPFYSAVVLLREALLHIPCVCLWTFMLRPVLNAML